MTKPKLLTALSIGAAFLLGATLTTACAGPRTTDGSQRPRRIAAETCIMSGRAVTADSPSTVYMSKTVKFCCENCLNDWNRLSDAARATKLTTRR